jgi:hypothetical protein
VMYLDRHYYELFKNRFTLKFEFKIWILIEIYIFTSFLFFIINIQKKITSFYMHSLSKSSMTKTFTTICNR